MKKDQQKSEDYVRLIIEDDLNRIVGELTISHEHNFIERHYEFDDGAVVSYQWQDFPFAHTPGLDIFNHKFTLITPPSPNPDDLKPGVVKIIDFPRN